MLHNRLAGNCSNFLKFQCGLDKFFDAIQMCCINRDSGNFEYCILVLRKKRLFLKGRLS